jgi:hypothetical protein
MKCDTGRTLLNVCAELNAGVLAGLGGKAKAKAEAEAKEKEKAKE